MIYLDTHVVVWLYAGETERLPAPVVDLIENNDLLISPLVILELQYLREIGRLLVDGGTIVTTLTSAIGLAVCDLPLTRVVGEALTMTWTRDPFDRLITATAALREAILISKDSTILRQYPRARWD